MTIRQTYELLQEHKEEWRKISTIDELKEFDARYGLKLQEKRFYIGVYTMEPKVFGISRDLDTGNIIVYKNKDNGEQKVRYEGSNEKTAVRIIMDKFEEELNNRIPSGETKFSSEKKIFGLFPQTHFIGGVTGVTIIIIASLFSHGKLPIFVALFLSLFGAIGCAAIAGAIRNLVQKKDIATSLFFIVWGTMFGVAPIAVSIMLALPDGTGYYSLPDQALYYKLDNNWYYYDNSINDWVDSEWDYYTYGDYEDYYEGYNYDNAGLSFSDSEAYSDYVDSHTSSSSDSDWDSGSDSSWDSDWDSGDTDWGSDW